MESSFQKCVKKKNDVTYNNTINPGPGSSRRRNSYRIFIPEDARTTLLPACPVISVRLRNVLACQGFKTFGDIHGRQLSEFLQLRRCGKTTILELEALLSGVQGFVTGPDLPPQPALMEPRRFPKNFSVAAVARDLNPLDVPLSLRAEKSLRGLGVQRLGDLEGVAMSKLTRLKGCGDRTFREIQALLQRASAGEFAVTPETLGGTISLDLLPQIDEILRMLSNRDLEIVTLRLAGSGPPPGTLKTIGARYNITRERVRQILRKIFGSFVRFGGPRFKAFLNAIAAFCHSHVCPLTPSLLKSWAPKPWPLRYKAEFYVRLIARIRPDIPTCLEGQNPRPAHGQPPRKHFGRMEISPPKMDQKMI